MPDDAKGATGGDPETSQAETTDEKPAVRIEAPGVRVRMSGHERREQLIRIGRRVFAERGYEAATVEEIADRAKITKPVVYEHFGGKEGLYAVVVDREVTRLLALIRDSLGAPGPRAALEQAVTSFLGYVEEEPDGFRILIREGPPVGTARGANIMEDIAAQVEAILAKELRSRGLERKVAPVLSRALVGMVALTGQWWLESKEPKRKVVAAQLVNLAWNGLGNLERKPSLETDTRKSR